MDDLFHTLGLHLSRSQSRRISEKFVTRDAIYYRKLTDLPKDEEFINHLEAIDEKTMLEIATGGVLPAKSVSIDASKTDGESDSSAKSTVQSNDGLVLYKGSLYDLRKLLEQVSRSEEARGYTEGILEELKQKNSDLTTSNTRMEKKIKELTSDLKSVNRKLTDTDQHLSSTNVSWGEISLLFDLFNFVLLIPEKIQ